jgi:hypothetical protein
MKLYRKTRKRLAKKQLRHYWKKLNFGRHLKPGDLISTCVGYNQIIEKIEPWWCQGGKFVNRLVVDFNIITTDGTSHSLTHCCEDHIEGRDKIIAYWLECDNPEYIDWYNKWSCDPNGYDNSFSAKVVRALRAGEEVFLPDGRLSNLIKEK